MANVSRAKNGSGYVLSAEATERKRQWNREYMRRRYAQRSREEQNAVNAYNAAYRARNPEKVKAWSKKFRVRRLYGLTLEQYDELKARGCALCGAPDSLHIDHDHETGIVRGVLCQNCNRGLGMFRDDPDLLVRAADYLKEAHHHRERVG